MTGRLQSWSLRGFGIVAVTLKQVFFLHASNVSEMPDGVETPEPGSIVHFDEAPPINGGRFPQAVNARIIADTNVAKDVVR